MSFLVRAPDSIRSTVRSFVRPSDTNICITTLRQKVDDDHEKNIDEKKKE